MLCHHHGDSFGNEFGTRFQRLLITEGVEQWAYWRSQLMVMEQFVITRQTSVGVNISTVSKCRFTRFLSVTESLLHYVLYIFYITSSLWIFYTVLCELKQAYVYNTHAILLLDQPGQAVIRNRFKVLTAKKRLRYTRLVVPAVLMQLLTKLFLG